MHGAPIRAEEARVASAAPPTIDLVILAIDTSAGTAVAVVDRDGGVLAERSDRRHPSARRGDRHADRGRHDRGRRRAARPQRRRRGRRARPVHRAPGRHRRRPCLRVRRRRALPRRRQPRRGRLRAPQRRGGQVGRRRRRPPRLPARRRDRRAPPRGRRGRPGLASTTTASPCPPAGPRSWCRRSSTSATGASSAWPRHRPRRHAWSRPAALGMLAERLFEHGRPFADAAPLYLREPDVTPAARPKTVSQ